MRLTVTELLLANFVPDATALSASAVNRTSHRLCWCLLL